MTCETLPMCPETAIPSGASFLSEPIEVGPFRQGIVFVTLAAPTPEPVEVEVGISPTGYDDWKTHWSSVRTERLEGGGMQGIRLSNFGNWLRLRVRNQNEQEASVMAWFVGE